MSKSDWYALVSLVAAVPASFYIPYAPQSIVLSIIAYYIVATIYFTYLALR